MVHEVDCRDNRRGGGSNPAPLEYAAVSLAETLNPNYRLHMRVDVGSWLEEPFD